MSMSSPARLISSSRPRFSPLGLRFERFLSIIDLLTLSMVNGNIRNGYCVVRFFWTVELCRLML